MKWPSLPKPRLRHLAIFLLGAAVIFGLIRSAWYSIGPAMSTATPAKSTLA